MSEPAIDDEQLSTTSSIKSNPANVVTTPSREMHPSSDVKTPPIRGSDSYVEARHPTESQVDVPLSNGDFRANEQNSSTAMMVSNFKEHLDRAMDDMKDQNRRDFEKSE